LGIASHTFTTGENTGFRGGPQSPRKQDAGPHDRNIAEVPAGNAVGVVHVRAELTTREAADLLNVSRPHFINLHETHALPYHGTGKHRRIRFDDLVKFKVERDQASERAVSELAEQAQELKLGYDSVGRLRLVHS
jgi:excisionase family DNA binding protein